MAFSPGIFVKVIYRVLKLSFLLDHILLYSDCNLDYSARGENKFNRIVDMGAAELLPVDVATHHFWLP